ncbi:MAG: FAD-dependent oxidoreductase [Acidimicrobiales bacterium]|nr:FAD-dependent oxidoreductase [Acidimicrobiales bacterium]
MTTDRHDLVIVGMGSAGLAAAEFAASLELRVAAVERARIGGAAVWSGSAPSKALVAAGRLAHTVRRAGSFGVVTDEPEVDLDRVWRRIADVCRELADGDDEPDRFANTGIELVRGHGRLTGPNEVTVRTGDGERILQARFVLLCTGSRPIVPDVDGLDTVPTLTSDSLFLAPPPQRLVVLGGGPMGVETAQALRRLGLDVTLVERQSTLLPREEPSLVAQLTDVLVSEGVEVLTATAAVAARRAAQGVELDVSSRPTRGPQRDAVLHADAVVVACGRAPQLADLGLEELGIEVGPRGAVVDERARTTFRSVYAVGDLIDGTRHAHAAEHAAVRAVRDMFLPGRAPVADLVPWCTFSDPELAHVGLTTAEAEALHGDDADVWRIDLAHNDRARIEGTTVGGIEGTTVGGIVVVTAKDRIVGGHVLAPGAGELIHELALAVRHEFRLADLADLVHVHPTMATSVGMLAAESASEKAQRYRWLVRRR